MELKGNTIGFRGEYRATVLKADGTVKEFLNEEKTLKSNDIIRNRLLDNFFSRLISVDSAVFSSARPSIRCGAGSASVVDSQTSLSSQLTLASGYWPQAGSPVTHPSASVNVDKVTGVATFVFTFALGQITGNISELGINFIGTQTVGDTLVHSRALVVDANDNPTVISVLSNEQLILTYNLYYEIGLADSTQTVTYNVSGTPTDVDVTIRHRSLSALRGYVDNPASAIVYSGDLGSQFTAPSNAITSGLSVSTAYNSSGGKLYTLSLAIGQGNHLSGISAIAFTQSYDGGGAAPLKIGFNPPIPKNSDRTLSISILQTFGRLP